MNKNVEIRRIQGCVYLFYEKNFHFFYADSQVFTGISENIFKKSAVKVWRMRKSPYLCIRKTREGLRLNPLLFHERAIFKVLNAIEI